VQSTYPYLFLQNQRFPTGARGIGHWFRHLPVSGAEALNGHIEIKILAVASAVYL
jgi:hypothetical protein